MNERTLKNHTKAQMHLLGQVAIELAKEKGYEPELMARWQAAITEYNKGHINLSKGAFPTCPE